MVNLKVLNGMPLLVRSPLVIFIIVLLLGGCVHSSAWYPQSNSNSDSQKFGGCCGP